MGDMDDEFELKRNGSECFLIETWNQVPLQRIQAVFQWDDPEAVPVRIGLVGTHATNKTALARRLSKALNIPLIEEVARGCFDMGLALNKNADAVSELLIYIGQLYEQLTMEEFVSDNCLLGILSYFEWLKNKRKILNSLSFEYLFIALKNLTNRIMPTYTAIFYLPPANYPTADGYRSVDKRFHREIDQLILNNLESMQVDYFPLPGSLTDKFKAAMTYLEDSGILADGD